MSDSVRKYASYKKKIDEVRGGIVDVKEKYCSYEEALEIVKDYIQKKKVLNEDIGDNEIKDGEYLKRKKKKYMKYIDAVTRELKLNVYEFKDDKGYIKFKNELLSDIVGYSVLEDAFADEKITDIFVMTYNNIWIRKNGNDYKWHKTFRSEEHYLRTLERFLKEAGKEMNDGDKKIVHFELYGNRGTATSGKISKRNPSLTMRTHNDSDIDTDFLIKNKVLNVDMKNFISMLLRGEEVIVVVGITGSGKTTTMQSVIRSEIEGKKRIVSGEDTPELKFAEGENILQLVTFEGKTSKETVGLDELVMTLLRLNPRMIAIGEVRGGADLVSAIECGETGHGTIFSYHSSSARSAFNRMSGKYMRSFPNLGQQVVEMILADAIGYFIVQDDVPGEGRHITEICSVSYDYEINKPILKPIFIYDIFDENFKKVGGINKGQAMKLYRRGIKKDELALWMEDETA